MSEPFLQRCCRCLQIKSVYATEGTRHFCKACALTMQRKSQSQNQELQPVTDPSESPQERIEAALTELISAGQPFLIKDVLAKSGLHKEKFYKAKTSELDKKIKQAIAQAKRKPAPDTPFPPPTSQPSTPDPTYTALQAKIQELTQANRGLELRNKQLRQQLQEQAEAPPRLVEVAMPLTWLEQQAQAWRDTVADYQAELEQIQADITAAQANLEAFERLIGLHDATPVTTADLNAALNGHNGNGKAIATGGNS